MTVLSLPEQAVIRSTEILTVGGRPFAFGLRWTSATSRANLEEEAKAAAIAEAANYVVIHKVYNQFGLATLSDAPTGSKRWFYRPQSGVATIAQAVGTATLAAFPLDDDRWLVLMIDRKGILPDGDLIVASAEEAKARIDRLIAQNPTTWRKKLLPDEWAVPDSKSVDPNELLSRSGAPKLMPLWQLMHRRSLQWTAATVAACLLATAFVALKELATPAPIAVLPPLPIRTAAASFAPATETLGFCLAAVLKAQRYLALPGWAITRFNCAAEHSLSVELARIGAGQINTIAVTAPGAVLADDGRTATLTVPLPVSAHATAEGPFAPRYSFQAVGLDLAQRLNGNFSLQAGRKMLPGETAAFAPATWQQFTWTYRTQAPPVVWASAIAHLGPVSVERVTYAPSEKVWQVEGSVYAHP